MEDENLLREVVGDDKNDKKRVANLNEENSDDEEVLLSQLNHIDSYVFKSKQSMHNLISFNSLRPWMNVCLLYTSPSPRDSFRSRMPSSA